MKKVSKNEMMSVTGGHVKCKCGKTFAKYDLACWKHFYFGPGWKHYVVK